MTRDASSFDRLYRDLGDPWDYETSSYETDKYDRCLRLLSRPRYARALEIGCSIGVMSAAIAARSGHLLGIDFAPTAVARARRRGIPNARFEVGSVPRDWPTGAWDLIVLSEVLYYLDAQALERTIVRVAHSLARDGDCLVAGYTGDTDTQLSARDVEEQLLAGLGALRPRHRIRRDAHPSWIAAVFTCHDDRLPEG
ncbi:MAG: methyltransferase domain-containing protein [Rhodobacteraceae bacterium]|uniref:class I SAM-dependent DNA methyltransferase n=1 Tax=Salipiger thiooxidans TaxID=282683 RepID=UPI001A8C3725|nr:class I SAM-dependent methyltransferase [Salipiger thiooxidans]MBN8189760.1 methyltransferase domain-containing protein [Salipiger thiooxidans]MBR9840530.1 methyltransferase domain-containing protein [Paracoccaceae bacterium]